MLGTNAVLNIHFKNPADPIQDSQKKLDFDTFQNQQRFQPQSSEPFLPSLRYLEFRVALLVNECAADDAEKCKQKPKPAPGVVDLLKNANVVPIKVSGPVNSRGPSPGIFKQLIVASSGTSPSSASMLCGPYGDLDVLTSRSGANASKTEKSNCAAARIIEILNDKPDKSTPPDASPWVVFTPEIAAALDECSTALKTYQISGPPKNLEKLRDSRKIAQSACKPVIQYLKGDSIDLAAPVVPSVQLRWSIDQTVLDCATKEQAGQRWQEANCLVTDREPSTTGISARNFVSDKSYRLYIISQKSAKLLYCQRLPIRRPLLPDMYVYMKDRALVIFGVVTSTSAMNFQIIKVHGRKTRSTAARWKLKP